MNIGPGIEGTTLTKDVASTPQDTEATYGTSSGNRAVAGRRIAGLTFVALAAVAVLAGCSSSKTTNQPPATGGGSGTTIPGGSVTTVPGSGSATTVCTIPQNNGGDHDSDNNGGPNDGDGCDV